MKMSKRVMIVSVLLGLAGLFAVTSMGSHAESSTALVAPVTDNQSLEKQPSSAGEAMAPTGALGSAQAEDGECDGTMTTEDAASCSAGGWKYAGCCTNATRWTRPGQVKCCGACMQ